MSAADTIAAAPSRRRPKGGKAATRRTIDLVSRENKKGMRPMTCDFGLEVRMRVQIVLSGPDRCIS